MIWSVRRRDEFNALRDRGVRFREGPVRVQALRAEDGPPRVAFAIGRSVGTAVVRNSLRRRVRATLRQRAREGRPVPAGWYLFSVAPAGAAIDATDLRAHVERLCDHLDRLEGP